MFKLKDYQLKALAALKSFLSDYKNAIDNGSKPRDALQDAYQRAFNANGFAKRSLYNYIFDNVPSVCLRIPTGGGKTIVAASAIKDIDEGTIESGAPVVLWLTPSDAITTQTYEALNNSSHPYRQSLEKQYPGKVKVCDIDSIQTVQKSDFRNYCIIIVATNQTFNIKDTSQRNAYSFNENFESFFVNLPLENSAGLEKVTKEEVQVNPSGYLKEKDINRVKYSLANLLRLYQPILIIDEAHNNRTATYFNTLNRLAPSACLELTATPMPSNNTIFSVSAWDLKVENMIKLPILLTATEGQWESCLNEAVETQKKLEKKAREENQYIRPIVLIQAENKNGTAKVEDVKDYLINALAIPENWVAVYTGSRKDFKSSELFSKDCPIRYVVTVRALKEGWDCSFAYILCGLQDMQSSKDTEQLMGRVLRMPYAQKRIAEELNQAYAYLQSTRTRVVALKLQDGLVKNLGFDRLDAADLIQQKRPTEMADQGELFPGMMKPRKDTIAGFVITAKPEEWEREIEEKGLKGKISVQPLDQNTPTTEKQEIYVSTNALLNQKENENVEAIALKTTDKSDEEDTQDRLNAFRYEQDKVRCAAIQKESFKKVPLLLIHGEDGLPRPFSSEASFVTEWNPIGYGLELANFPPKQTKELYILDSDKNKKFQIRTKEFEESVQDKNEFLFLSEEFNYISAEYLINWLTNQIQRRDLKRSTLLHFIQKIITSELMGEKNYSLNFLNANRVPLAKAISRRLDDNYEEAKRAGFQQLLNESFVSDDDKFAFEFLPEKYLPSRIYEVRNGARQFEKHYFPKIHDLRYKTEKGTVTEEYECAVAIDMNPKVKFWVRNIESSSYSFRLSVPTGNFYPDFIVQLEDGRLLVIEYKGAQILGTPDTHDKELVGKRWEEASGGSCLFLLARKDDKGLDVAQQIDRKIAESKKLCSLRPCHNSDTTTTASRRQAFAFEK